MAPGEVLQAFLPALLSLPLRGQLDGREDGGAAQHVQHDQHRQQEEPRVVRVEATRAGAAAGAATRHPPPAGPGCRATSGPCCRRRASRRRPPAVRGAQGAAEPGGGERRSREPAGTFAPGAGRGPGTTRRRARCGLPSILRAGEPLVPSRLRAPQPQRPPRGAPVPATFISPSCPRPEHVGEGRRDRRRQAPPACRGDEAGPAATRPPPSASPRGSAARSPGPPAPWPRWSRGPGGAAPPGAAPTAEARPPPPKRSAGRGQGGLAEGGCPAASSPQRDGGRPPSRPQARAEGARSARGNRARNQSVGDIPSHQSHKKLAPFAKRGYLRLHRVWLPTAFPTRCYISVLQRMVVEG